MFAGLNGRVSSMSASAGDREPGVPLDNAKEEIGGPTCTGEHSKHVSNYTEIKEKLLHSLLLYKHGYLQCAINLSSYPPVAVGNCFADSLSAVASDQP